MREYKKKLRCSKIWNDRKKIFRPLSFEAEEDLKCMAINFSFQWYIVKPLANDKSSTHSEMPVELEYFQANSY